MKFIAENNDNKKFVIEMERIVTAVTFSHELSPICVIKTDNWFDHKWLGHSKHKIPRSWKASKGFIADRGLPGFPKDRILYTDFFQKNDHRLELIEEEKPFITACKGCFFYSGNTDANKRGSLMVYISVENDQYWFWYVSFVLSHDLKIDNYKGISVEEFAHYKKAIS